MEFRCRLGTAGGEVIEGIYVADSEAHLRRELEEKGLHVFSLAPRRGLAALSFGRSGRGRISRQEFLVFNQELAALLKAGMPLVQSLDLLRQRLANQVFKAVLDDVYEKVRAGAALSEAFEAHAGRLPGVYIASLMGGERSGSLDAVLRRYVAYAKIIDTVRRRTISALIYPAVLIGLAAVLVGIIVLRVVPAFTDFYGSFDAALPLSTQVIVAVSDLVRREFWLIAAVTVGGAVAARAWLQRPGARARVDRAVLRLPRLGETVHKFATAQVARTLATLLGGGIPLVQALEVASRAAGNRHLGAELAHAAQRVREGQSLSATLRERRAVPDVAVKMIEVGEQTGSLQDMLTSLADFYDEDVETDVSRFVTLIEPALLVVMGLVIAVIVLALYMPLFQLTAVMGR